MATVVKHAATNHYYLLVGTSYSYFKDSRPSFLGGTLFPHEEDGVFNLAAVCDENGSIEWIPTEELQVVSIDGKPVNEILEEYAGR